MKEASAMRQVLAVHDAAPPHWVGDGFPVRSVFSYDGLGREALSPFLMLDYAAPRHFDPAPRRRGVGVHPHRGFETVTIVYQGELEHRDSTGNGGRIGPGDVQWMTAAGGIIHEEFHSQAYTKTGGPFRMVQLWVNLPAKDKMSPPGYQSITDADIPVVELNQSAGRVRVIAGNFAGTSGPARTFSPVNVWDVRLNRGADVTFDLPEGHTAMIAALSGHVTFNGSEQAGEAEIIRFERDGSQVRIHAESDSIMLVLTGEPIKEPVVGHGPFVMNSEAEIRQAVDDFNRGRFGQVAH
jgi:redox-sensitive bicupin YhaK (pirin superfamily)